jgi:hypothetical protein
MGFSVEEIEEELKRIKMVNAVLCHSFSEWLLSALPCALRGRMAGQQLPVTVHLQAEKVVSASRCVRHNDCQ